MSLPDGYFAPTGMVAGTNGVWFFAQGSVAGIAHESVFFYNNESRALAIFDLDTSVESLRAGLLAPMTVDSQGDAWLGINQSILQIDPVKGIVGVTALPDVPVSALSSGLPRPPGENPSATSAIESLAIDSGGKVFIARDSATSLQVFDPSSGTVTSIAVPLGTIISGNGLDVLTSHDSNSTIDVILYAGKGVEKIGELSLGSWVVESETCWPLSISGTSTQLIINGSSNCFAIQQSSSSSADGSTDAATTEIETPGFATTVPMSTSTILLTSSKGMQTWAAGQFSQPFNLGSAPSGVALGGGGNDSKLVLVLPSMTAASPAGGVWFVPNRGDNQIGYMTLLQH